MSITKIDLKNVRISNFSSFCGLGSFLSVTSISRVMTGRLAREILKERTRGPFFSAKSTLPFFLLVPKVFFHFAVRKGDHVRAD